MLMQLISKAHIKKKIINRNILFIYFFLLFLRNELVLRILLMCKLRRINYKLFSLCVIRWSVHIVNK